MWIVLQLLLLLPYRRGRMRRRHLLLIKDLLKTGAAALGVPKRGAGAPVAARSSTLLGDHGLDRRGYAGAREADMLCE